jgi:hypothetical protein
MAPKKNPLNLNPLQSKTLAVLQHMAVLPRYATPEGEDGSVRLGNFPAPHGNHYHLGDAQVSGADMTGLHNPAVFTVLARKGLIADPSTARGVVLTPRGLAYDTGLADRILHRGHD